MTRRILLGFALGAAALAPAPADAGQICARVTVTGVVNYSQSTPCVTIGPGTGCGSYLVQFPPTSSAEVWLCNPMPFAGGQR